MLPKAYAPAGMYAPTYTGGGQTLASSGNPQIDLATSSFVTNVLSAGGFTVNTAQQAVLPNLITAASRMMIRFMGGRLFPVQQFTEIVTPYGNRQDRGEPAQAKLSYFPVRSVVRCATSRNTALLITNNATTTNQDASVQFNINGYFEFLGDLSYTGISLNRWASGTQHTDVISWTMQSPFTTLQSIADQVNALGGGWQASVQNAASGVAQTAGFPAYWLAGVREPKYAFSPGAGLDLFIQTLTSYDIDRSSGILSLYWGGGWGNATGWGGFGPGDPWGTGWDGSGGYGFGWGGGWNQVQVIYTAGWDTIPEDLQLVTAEVVKLTLDRLKLNMMMKTQSGANAQESWSYAINDAIRSLPEWALTTLYSYRDWSV